MAAKRRIIKVHSVSMWELYDKLGEVQDVKVYVSFKVKKRRKIKRMHIHYLGYKIHCDCCGPVPVLDYTMAGERKCNTL